MVNPVVLYVPPALPVPQTSSTALVPYQPQGNTDPLAFSDSVAFQIVVGNGTEPPSPTSSKWWANAGGLGWTNEATPGDAAGAYSATARMSAGAPPLGQFTDMSV